MLNKIFQYSNKNNGDNTAFTPVVSVAPDVQTATTIEFDISSNLPNQTLLLNLVGNITSEDMSNAQITNAPVTLDSSGNGTLTYNLDPASNFSNANVTFNANVTSNAGNELAVSSNVIIGKLPALEATGGTVTQEGEGNLWTIHTFEGSATGDRAQTSDNFVITAISQPLETMHTLILGGGGAGTSGYRYQTIKGSGSTVNEWIMIPGSGGGAGEVKESNVLVSTLSVGTMPVLSGHGGERETGGGLDRSGASGGASVFNGITARGGQGGNGNSFDTDQTLMHGGGGPQTLSTYWGDLHTDANVFPPASDTQVLYSTYYDQANSDLYYKTASNTWIDFDTTPINATFFANVETVSGDVTTNIRSGQKGGQWDQVFTPTGQNKGGDSGTAYKYENNNGVLSFDLHLQGSGGGGGHSGPGEDASGNCGIGTFLQSGDGGAGTTVWSTYPGFDTEYVAIGGGGGGTDTGTEGISPNATGVGGRGGGYSSTRGSFYGEDATNYASGGGGAGSGYVDNTIGFFQEFTDSGAGGLGVVKIAYRSNIRGFFPT